MTTEDLVKLLSAGGFAGALLYLLYLVGSRMVAAIDRVAAKVDSHTSADLESHASLGKQVERIEAKIDAREGFTPVGGMDIPRMEDQASRRTPARGLPSIIERRRGRGDDER